MPSRSVHVAVLTAADDSSRRDAMSLGAVVVVPCRPGTVAASAGIHNGRAACVVRVEALAGTGDAGLVLARLEG